VVLMGSASLPLAESSLACSVGWCCSGQIECHCAPWARLNGGAISQAMLLSAFRLAGLLLPPVGVRCHSQPHCSATCSQQPSIWHSIECLGLAERWCGRPGHTLSAHVVSPASHSVVSPAPAPHAQVADPLSAGKWRKILDFAPAMWSSDYRPFLRIEDPAAQAALDALPQSSYRRRLSAEAAVAYDTKALKRARSAVGMLARVANTRAWTFSVVARSLSWFNQRVPHRVWADACEDRYVASRPRCLALLHEMRRVEPQPAWTHSPNVFVFAADQTYCWQGCQKRGRARQGAERTDSSGMPMIIRSEVYLSCRRPKLLRVVTFGGGIVDHP